MALRILYVDDEEDIREVAEISLMLDPEVEVQTCATGEHAVAQVREWRPDVILLDVMMPGMDGPSTFRVLKSQPETRGIPIIFITALTQASEMHSLIELGPQGVLSKPFDPMSLAAEVRRLVERSGGESGA